MSLWAHVSVIIKQSVNINQSVTSHSSFSSQVGVSLLFVGIVALNQVRMEIPLEKENQTKLVKFMIRMGVFSALYLVPLLTVIGCYLYEHTYRSIWETTWMKENCRRYHIPCPFKVECVGVSDQFHLSCVLSAPVTSPGITG